MPKRKEEPEAQTIQSQRFIEEAERLATDGELIATEGNAGIEVVLARAKLDLPPRIG